MLARVAAGGEADGDPDGEGDSHQPPKALVHDAAEIAPRRGDEAQDNDPAQEPHPADGPLPRFCHADEPGFS